MKKTTALIFGLNDYTFEIQKNIQEQYENVYIFQLSGEGENSFDLSDNWDDLSEKVDIESSTAFCALEDMAENIFLTISLRDTFTSLDIIALSLDEESQTKLMLAGATNVLPTIQTTANVIVDILEKPTVTKVLHEILYEKSSLKIAQIKVENEAVFDGKNPANIEWSRDYGIIIISLVHEDNSRDFIYAPHLKNYKVRNGDVFVVVGYDEDIKKFEKFIGKKNED